MTFTDYKNEARYGFRAVYAGIHPARLGTEGRAWYSRSAGCWMYMPDGASSMDHVVRNAPFVQLAEEESK